MHKRIETYEEGLRHLNSGNSKAIIHIKGTMQHIKVGKADLIYEIKKRQREGAIGPCDKDGRPYAWSWYPSVNTLFITGWF